MGRAGKIGEKRIDPEPNRPWLVATSAAPKSGFDESSLLRLFSLLNAALAAIFVHVGSISVLPVAYGGIGRGGFKTPLGVTVDIQSQTAPEKYSPPRFPSLLIFASNLLFTPCGGARVPGTVLSGSKGVGLLSPARASVAPRSSRMRRRVALLLANAERMIK